MAWFGVKNTWGNFPDLVGVVNKLQESVKNIEKNFDTALGFEEKAKSSNEDAGSWPLPGDPKALFNPVMAFMGNNSEESTEETSDQLESSQQESGTKKSLEKPEFPDHARVAERKEGFENDNTAHATAEETTLQEVNEAHKVDKEDGEQTESADGNTAHATTEETTVQEEGEVLKAEVEDGKRTESADGTTAQNLDHRKEEHRLPDMLVDLSDPNIQNAESLFPVVSHQENEIAEVGISESSLLLQPKPINLGEDQVEGSSSDPGDSQGISDVQEKTQVETDEESKKERAH